MPTVKISGMRCGHCTAAVTKALTAIEGISEVVVDLERGEASYQQSGAIAPETIKAAISRIGFVVEGV